MPCEKRIMSLCVEYLGVLGVFGVPSVVALGVPGVVDLGVPRKVSIWVPGNIVF